MNLNDCIPQDKFDHAAVANAAAVGYPAINKILPELLEWLQDLNWPVAQEVAELLADAGPEISPHLCDVLRHDDNCWKHSIMQTLAKDINLDAWHIIESDVLRIANDPSNGEKLEEVDLVAREVLALRADSTH